MATGWPKRGERSEGWELAWSLCNPKRNAQLGKTQFGRTLVAALRRIYGNQVVREPGDDPAGCSVAGALSLAYGASNPFYEPSRFPDAKQFAELLCELNPELRRSSNPEYLGRVVKLHHEGQTEEAWEQLVVQLVWPHYRDPRLRRTYREKIEFEERGDRLRFRHAMRKSRD